MLNKLKVDREVEGLALQTLFFDDGEFEGRAIRVSKANYLKFLCSGQLIPDSILSFSSAATGEMPPLNECGRCR
ncbi:hypothetical protein SAMN04487963_3640, partial [Marinobacter zhejiangensis]